MDPNAVQKILYSAKICIDVEEDNGTSSINVPRVTLSSRTTRKLMSLISVVGVGRHRLLGVINITERKLLQAVDSYRNFFPATAKGSSCPVRDSCVVVETSHQTEYNNMVKCTTGTVVGSSSMNLMYTTHAEIDRFAAFGLQDIYWKGHIFVTSDP
jgi:hypothetical protein